MMIKVCPEEPGGLIFRLHIIHVYRLVYWQVFGRSEKHLFEEIRLTLDSLYNLLGSCPASHPHVYLNGNYCCKYAREKHYAPAGSTCDGGPISFGSTCCQGDTYVRCPHPPCVGTEHAIIASRAALSASVIG